MKYARAQKQIVLMSVLSVLGVTLVGLLPYMAMEGKAMDEDGDEKDVTHFFVYPMVQELSNAAPAELDDADPMVQELSNAAPAELDDAAEYLEVMYFMVWMTFAFCIFALLGLMMIRLDVAAKAGGVFVFLGSLAWIFALLAMVMFSLAAYHLSEADMGDDMEAYLAYNYVPLVTSALVMIFGLLLFFQSGLPLLGALSRGPYGYAPAAAGWGGQGWGGPPPAGAPPRAAPAHGVPPVARPAGPPARGPEGDGGPGSPPGAAAAGGPPKY